MLWRNFTMLIMYKRDVIISCSVSDPYNLDADPDPDSLPGWWIRIRVRIRIIRPIIEQVPIFFFLISSVQGLKLITMFFCCNFSLIFAYIKQNQRLPLKKKIIFYNFGWFVCELITIFFWYPDPDQRFLMRIRILPNDTDPTGSGSETLISCQGQYYYVRTLNCTV